MLSAPFALSVGESQQRQGDSMTKSKVSSFVRIEASCENFNNITIAKLRFELPLSNDCGITFNGWVTLSHIFRLENCITAGRQNSLPRTVSIQPIIPPSEIQFSAASTRWKKKLSTIFFLDYFTLAVAPEGICCVGGDRRGSSCTGRV